MQLVNCLGGLSLCPLFSQGKLVAVDHFISVSFYLEEPVILVASREEGERRKAEHSY